MVRGLLYSNIKIATAPPKTRISVADKAILLCRVNRFKHFIFSFLKFFNTRIISHQTI